MDNSNMVKCKHLIQVPDHYRLPAQASNGVMYYLNLKNNIMTADTMNLHAEVEMKL